MQRGAERYSKRNKLYIAYIELSNPLEHPDRDVHNRIENKNL